MSEKDTGGVHWSFWLIGAVALVWNAMGVANIFMQMNPVVVAALLAWYSKWTAIRGWIT